MEKILKIIQKVKSFQPTFSKTAWLLSFTAFLFLFVGVVKLSMAQTNETQPQPIPKNSENQQVNRGVQTATEIVILIAGDPTGKTPGALDYAGSLIGFLYTNPPASSKIFVNYVAEKLQPTPVYAKQIEGFEALNPLLELWKSSLTAALFLTTVIFLVIGFMIMFRRKIGPQTVTTVQNALPSIIVTLIIVYLSYAIVGLLLDFSNLLTSLSLAIFVKGRVDNLSQVRDMTIFDAFHFGKMFFNIFHAVSTAVGTAFNNVNETSTFGADHAKLSILGMNLSLIYGIPGKVIGGIIGWIIASLGTFVILFAMLITVFRVFFALLTAYATIVIYTIIAPIQIILGGLPGQSKFISGWFKGVLANVLIFPAVFTVLIFAAVIAGTDQDVLRWASTQAQGAGAIQWKPPLINLPDTSSINTLISLGLLLLTPKVPEAIKKAFGTEAGFMGGAASEGLSKIPFMGGYAKEGK